MTRDVVISADPVLLEREMMAYATAPDDNPSPLPSSVFVTWLDEQTQLTQLQYAQFMTNEVRPDHTVEGTGGTTCE